MKSYDVRNARPDELNLESRPILKVGTLYDMLNDMKALSILDHEGKKRWAKSNIPLTFQYTINHVSYTGVDKWSGIGDRLATIKNITSVLVKEETISGRHPYYFYSDATPKVPVVEVEANELGAYFQNSRLLRFNRLSKSDLITLAREAFDSNLHVSLQKPDFLSRVERGKVIPVETPTLKDLAVLYKADFKTVKALTEKSRADRDRKRRMMNKEAQDGSSSMVQ